jgi:hypothetical protein
MSYVEAQRLKFVSSEAQASVVARVADVPERKAR